MSKQTELNLTNRIFYSTKHDNCHENEFKHVRNAELHRVLYSFVYLWKMMRGKFPVKKTPPPQIIPQLNAETFI